MVDLNNKCSKILIFNEESMQECASILIGEYEEGYECKHLVTEFVKYDDDTVVVFMGNEAFLTKIPSGEVLSRCAINGMTQTGTIDEDKNVYFSIQKKIFKLEI